MTRAASRTCLGLLGLPLIMCACSDRPAPSKSIVPVKVAVAMPVQRIFHNHVIAWGRVAVDPHATRIIDLPYGVRVNTLQVIADQAVQRNQPLMTVAPDPDTRRAYEQAVNELGLTRKNLARVRQLSKLHLATQAQLDTAQKTLQDAQATLQSLRSQGGGRKQVLLRAPADGIITALGAHAGQHVAARTTLAVFVPTRAVVARLQILPEDLAAVHPGEAVHMQATYDKHKARTGTLSMLGQRINPQTGMVPAIARFDQPPSLAVGAAVSASIETSTLKAWAVPRGALQSNTQGNYVFQIKRGKAQRVQVKVPAPDGRMIGVVGPIDQQAPVITLGSHEVIDGDAVQAIPEELKHKTPGP